MPFLQILKFEDTVQLFGPSGKKRLVLLNLHPEMIHVELTSRCLDSGCNQETENVVK